MNIFGKPVFFYRGYTQAIFFSSIVFYVVFFQHSDIFEGTGVDTLMDAAGIGCLVAGEFLRIWAVSHVGRSTRSRRLKAPVLVTTGPYAYVRHPIYVGNFLIGLGMVILSEAMLFVLVFLVLFSIQYAFITGEEEAFLKGHFGGEFERYRQQTPKYIPRGILDAGGFSLGLHFPLKELGTVWGIVVGGFFFEWIESPSHHIWVIHLFRSVIGGSIL